jgi:uncharacterized protein with PIN domain
VDVVWIRLYGDLNDLVPEASRQRDVAQPVFLTRSVKDAIESLGVPHTEVDLVLVNGAPAGLGHPLRAGDRVSVYPPFRALDLAGLPRVQPPRPAEARFVLDTHLGRLATYLRMLGFDARYSRDAADADLADISAAEARILLSRDRGLLKRTTVRYGYLVRSSDPREQLVEVLQRYDLSSAVAPFSRCLHCNAPLRRADKAEVEDRLPPRTRAVFADFALCPLCDRIYWPGSHYDDMRHLIDWALAQSHQR